MHWTKFSSKRMLREHANTFLVHGGNDTDTNNLVRYTNLPNNY